MLTGKVIIVTGAAHGIGRATAKRCAALGAAVVAADVNGDGARAVSDEIAAAGGTALAHVVDVTVEDEVEALATETVKRFGGIHVLHNNAYAVHPDARTDIVNTSLEAWEWTMRTCLTSQFLCCRAVIPHMVRNGGGVIVNVSSGNGIAGGPRIAPYGAAKAGTIVLTKYVSTQYGKLGVRCNTIVPGWTLVKDDDELTEADRAYFGQALPDVCMTRLATPDDVAAVVAFLASDDAGYVQGATIEVNGGLLAHMPGVAGTPAGGVEG